MDKSSMEEIKDICFVLAPFKEPFNTDYQKILLPAIKAAGLEPLRADEIYGAKAVMDDIWKSINSARVILAEMTEKNPNVLYEVGLAHGKRKTVLMITQDEDDIPFDLKHIRYIPYQRIMYNWDKVLQQNIERNLLATLADNAESKIFPDDISPVPSPVEPPWKPNELHHVSLAVHDLEKSRAFYKNDLGLREIKKKM